VTFQTVERGEVFIPLPFSPKGHLNHSLPTGTRALSLFFTEGSQAPKLSPLDFLANL
jgi:hypothetical protein